MRNKGAGLLTAAFLFISSVVVSNTEVQAAQWNIDSHGWWYCHTDGSYTTNAWEYINGKWYYFDRNGYMVTGWQEIGGKWYYLYSDGSMASNTWIEGYYVGEDGSWRKAQWIDTAHGWWYCHADGSYTTSAWEYISGKWYYFDRNGYMVTGWQEIGGKWYYLYDDGTMASNTWIEDYYVGEDGSWRTAQWIDTAHGWWYCHADGSYTTSNWESINGYWYYFDGNGYMMTGWQEIDGSWYYLYDDGTMASNTWIGDCYVGKDGRWVSDRHVHKWKWVDWEKRKDGHACNGCSQDLSDWEWNDRYDCCGAFHTHVWILKPAYYICESCEMKKHEHDWRYEEPVYNTGTDEIYRDGYWKCWRCGNQSRDGKTMEPVSISDKGFKRGAIDRWTTPYDFPADGLENWVLVDASWEKPENSPPLQRIDMKGDRSLSPGDTGKYELIFTPASAAESVTWTSSNPSVLSVDNVGNYTAHATGTAKITAESVSAREELFVRVTSSNIGFVKEATLLVDGKSTPDVEITLDENGKQYDVTLQTNPAEAVYEVEYMIEDEVCAPDYSWYKRSVWLSKSFLLGTISTWSWENRLTFTNPKSEITTGKPGTATIVAIITDINGNKTELRQPVRIK